jgi:arabinogalactan endo-1,4-beta-galactosidase
MKLRTYLVPIGIGIVGLGCGSTNGLGPGDGAAGDDANAVGSGKTGGPDGSTGGSTGGSAGGSSGGSSGGSTGGSTGGSAGGSSGGSADASSADGTTADAPLADASLARDGTGGVSSAGSSAADGAIADASSAGTSDGAPMVSPPFTGSYHMGADITWVQHDEFYGAVFVDTDGVQKDILALLKNHGFNSVRMRIFVDPMAADGYDQVAGFGDLAHTVAMGQRIKQAGMGFLLSMHYSDNWADPGKQCIPVAWQQSSSGDGGTSTTFAELNQHVQDYTLNVLTTLKNAGALPDLVQVGNEITPGMLINLCDASGTPLAGAAGTSPVNGRATTANWPNLGTLLKTAIAAVKTVDPKIKTVLHIDKGGDVNASIAWIRNAQAQAVPFDVFADTCYVRWQGQPAGWQNTFGMLATTFPGLSFIIPEYANETATTPATPSTMRIANDIVFNMAGNRGLGAWIYEPEHPVQAGVGIGLFIGVQTDAGLADPWPTFTAAPGPMSVYDGMKTAYAGRL